MNPVYHIGSYGELSNMLHGALWDRARACFAQTERDKAALTTPEAVREWQQKMRAAFMAAIGGLPEETCDLAPAWGELRERDGYSVQNVMFIAAPGVPVTATVWRPLGWSGLRPGVLFPCGHHEYPREAPEYQETCTWFALNGYVTLAFDPPGQGERKLCWDPTLQRSFAGSGSAEHEHAGRQCELIGHNICRYFVRDGMRAFDVLAGLPEVDATRIAVTGNSGGGTQSSYLMIADDRLAAGMPCTFTTDRRIYMGRTHWHDAEQNLTGAIAAGLDYEDFYAAMAPKPTAIGAVTYDFFPIEGTRRAYERLRRLYATLGAEEKVALCEVETGHNYCPELRQFAIEWFNRWLQPEASFRQPGDFAPEPAETMRNTASGQISVSLPDSLGVFEQNCNETVKAATRRVVPGAAELHTRLGLPDVACPLNPRVLVSAEFEGVTAEKSFIVTEVGVQPDIMTVVPVLRLTAGPPTRALIYCCDGGIESVDAEREALLRTLAKRGVAVYLADPRGLGETTSRRLSPWDPGWLTDTWLSQYTRMCGTSPGALRAYDLVRVADHVRAREGNLALGLMAEGFVGWAGALALALGAGFDRVCLSRVPASLEEFATTWTVSPPEAYTIPGVLTWGDLPDFVAAGQPRQTLVVNPQDARGQGLVASTWTAHHAGAWQSAGEVAAVCGVDAVQAIAAIAAFWTEEG